MLTIIVLYSALLSTLTVLCPVLKTLSPYFHCFQKIQYFKVTGEASSNQSVSWTIKSQPDSYGIFYLVWPC